VFGLIRGAAQGVTISEGPAVAVSGEFLMFLRAAVLLYWEEGRVRRDKVSGGCRIDPNLLNYLKPRKARVSFVRARSRKVRGLLG